MPGRLTGNQGQELQLLLQYEFKVDNFNVRWFYRKFQKYTDADLKICHVFVFAWK